MISYGLYEWDGKTEYKNSDIKVEVFKPSLYHMSFWLKNKNNRISGEGYFNSLLKLVLVEASWALSLLCLNTKYTLLKKMIKLFTFLIVYIVVLNFRF